MQWHYIDTTHGWRWRFALFPFCLKNGPERTWVWLEWYQSRWGGDCTEISLKKSDGKVGRIPVERYP